MNRQLLEQFEMALGRRNPILASRLRPGLSQDRVRQLLQRAKVEGNVQPIVDLFIWKNGSDLDPGLTIHEATPFPQSDYMFMDCEFMLFHFKKHETWSKYQPPFMEVAGRYFPLFWNGQVSWLAVDLDVSNQSRVVFIEKREEKLVREAYVSFDAFLEDAIQANENNDKLTCFQTNKVA